ncbi:uncharacterized protein ver [Drosophila pseudoobscura]|uniref:Uncharacterized protein ver n=1 Tax=Drosophila pseudoobscura pseudoobscura TaxID=46245 RepID=A0A6I8UCP9_DROPS|nr:uncharacterized protein LOC4813807 [Drosophila pseudoobscura]
MAANLSISDIEDQVDNFIIRKPTHGPKSKDDSKEGPLIHENIPLVLKDILRVSRDGEREAVFTVSINKAPCHFRTCIVYAFVAGECPHHKLYRRYILDDSTASLEASIATKPWKRTTIAALHNEAALLSNEESYKQISESMMRLLSASLEYVDPSAIRRGHSVLLHCRPNFFRGNISLEASSFFIDKGKPRKLEIAFADHYIDWHKSYKI